jgi:hypothetical protein
VNWDEVSSLSHDPRGVPVPISLADGSLDQVLAAVTTVQNHLPDGSTWDGKSDLPMDEATFQQMVSEIEPGSSGGAPASSTSAPAKSATAPGTSSSPTSGAAPSTQTTPPTTGAPAGTGVPTGTGALTGTHPTGPSATTAAGSQSKAAN